MAPMIETLRTVCNRDCPDACGIVATVEDGRVTRLQGDPDHPITRGFLCHRTGEFLHTQYAPDRLTSPLLRKGAFLEPVSWEVALDFAAERLLAIRREYGPEAIFHYRSGGSLGVLKCLTDLLFERFGPVTVKSGDICSGAGDAAQMLDFGEEDSHDLHDLVNARNILLWGKNVFVSSPHTIPVLREARQQGAKLVLIDPVLHRTESLCESFLQPRPAGDFALAMAVARVLFEEGWSDPNAGTYCDHLDAFRAMAMARTVAAWCSDADVSVEAAVDLAWRLGPGKPTAILVGWGMGRRTIGGAIVRALDALAAISGNLGIPGGGVSFYFKRRRAFDTSIVKGDAPRRVSEITFGADILAADPPIRAVWVTAGNPVAMLPDSAKTVEALSTRDFVVVVDSFLTDTASLATLVLPTTTLLEADDILGAYGHHYVGVARPVVPPPVGVRSDLEIAQGLAERLGLADVLAGDARSWKRRSLSGAMVEAGVTLEALEARPVRNPLAPPVLFADRRFSTPTGRVNLITSPPVPCEAESAYPLWLLSLSTDKAQSSQWAHPVEGVAVATMHPEAAAVRDGEEAWIESALGRMRVRVRHDPRQRRDVVIVPKGGPLSQGRCANLLVRAQLTDIGEGGALYDERVRVIR